MSKKQRGSKKKFIIFIIIGIIIMLLLGKLFGNNFNQNLTKDVERYVVKRGDLSLTAVGSGKIKSSDVKRLMTKDNIDEIKVRIGDLVSKGDVLGTIIDQNYKISNFTSSYNGIVTSVPGATFSTYFEISDTNNLQMEIQVTEKDIHKIKADSVAVIYIDAIDMELEGTVSRIGLLGQGIGDLAVYDVTINFEKGNNDIYLGMTGSARINIETKENIIKVPVDALIEKNGKRYVLKSSWLDNINRPQSDYYVEVKTGISDANYLEITEGDIENIEILIISQETTNFRTMMRDH